MDDHESIRLKTFYTHMRGLKGIMFWELSCDDTEGTFISTIHQYLKGEKSGSDDDFTQLMIDHY